MWWTFGRGCLIITLYSRRYYWKSQLPDWGSNFLPLRWYFYEIEICYGCPTGEQLGRGCNLQLKLDVRKAHQKFKLLEWQQYYCQSVMWYLLQSSQDNLLTTSYFVWTNGIKKNFHSTNATNQNFKVLLGNFVREWQTCKIDVLIP